MLILKPMTSHDIGIASHYLKSYVAYHFSSLNLKNAVVLLKIVLA